MLKRAAWLLIVAGLCVSCQKFAEGRQTFRELLTLRDKISTKFHERVVDVSVNNKGDQIFVKFINSPLRTGTHDEKQKRADEVAAFVTENYKQPLSRVAIQFVSDQGEAGETYVGAAR